MSGEEPLSVLRKAVLLDRDGTLIKECNYLNDPERVELERGVAAALCALRDANYLLIMITNQSGIGRGLISQGQFEAVQERLAAELGLHGVAFHDVYHCPHHPSEARGALLMDCDCRKPKPGMLEAAIRDHDLDRARSFMVGDTLKDVDAGQRAGLRAVLLRTGYGGGSSPPESLAVRPDYVGEDLGDAVQNFILQDGD